MKEGELCAGPLNTVEAFSRRKEMLTTRGGSLTTCCLPLWTWDQKQEPAHRAQIFWRTGSFCPPWLPQAMYSCLPSMWLGWGMGSCFRAQSWNWQKLTAVCSPSLPLDVTAFNRLQSSKIATTDRSCQQLLSRRGDRFLGLPPLPPSQDPLLHLILLFPVSLKECFRLDFSLNSALIAFHKFSYAVSSYFPY